VTYALLLITEPKNAHIDTQFQKTEMYNNYIKDTVLLNSKASILKKLKPTQIRNQIPSRKSHDPKKPPITFTNTVKREMDSNNQNYNTNSTPKPNTKPNNIIAKRDK